jgi:sugar lactone lactonase YvrE
VLNIVAGAVVFGAVAACAKQDAKQETKSDSANAAASTGMSDAAAMATKVGEATGLSTPESVRYDPELDVFYVSNINGNPSAHDNNGFIAVIRADSTSVALKKLVEGGKNGVTLDAPKGLALSGDTLWVADINHVRAFNKKTGAKLVDIDLTSQKAQFLNDIAIGGDGAAYVTDTGIAFGADGSTSHPGIDQIFKITAGKATSLKAVSLNAPNGITWDKTNSRFVLAPFSGNAVQSWKEGDKSTATLATGAGGYDGIEVLADGRVLVSSWTDSTVNAVKGNRLSKIVTGVAGPADIGVDTKRNILAIPMFNDSKVAFFRVP